MGLNANSYCLHLGDTIFKLMGYEDDEETEPVFERYLELCKCAQFIDISQTNTSLDALALQIYVELSSRKDHE